MDSRVRRKTFEVILVVSSTLREVADGWLAGLLSRPFSSLGFAGCLFLTTVALRVRYVRCLGMSRARRQVTVRSRKTVTY